MKLEPRNGIEKQRMREMKQPCATSVSAMNTAKED